jgi:hypothetical protein
MKKTTTKQIYGIFFIVIAASAASYSQDATYHNLTVNNYLTAYGNAGIGGGIDQNHELSVFSGIYEVGPGIGPLWVFRPGSPNSNAGGTSWALSQSDAAIRGFSYWGNTYSAVMAAYSSLDYNNSTALIAADNNATFSAKLAYKDGTGILWPGYFLSQDANALQYGINVRNPNGTDAGGSATGILFSVEHIGEFGKGAIVYERKSGYGRGSFHFLQEINVNTNNPGLGNKVMTITNSGVVGIGVEPASSSTNRLEVQGNTVTTGNGSITGTLSVGSTISAGSTITVTNGDLVLQNGRVQVRNWTLEAPDYVFDSTYKLPSIDKVKKFVTKNKHLPDMPSAAEMKEKGIDLTEMNLRLLKKVEELTLWAINQDKEISEQKEEIRNLKSAMAGMKQ